VSAQPEVQQTGLPTKRSTKKASAVFLLAGLVVALVLAGVVSNYASSEPDGLDSVLREGCTFNEKDEIVAGECAAQGATDHELADSPLADYGVSGVNDSFLSTAIAGVVGVLLTLVIGFGVFALLRSRKPTDSTGDDG